jgi:hypothetical protein
MEKRIAKFKINVEVNTSKPDDEIMRAITKGIFKGLDTEPYNIAPPADVKVTFIYEMEL